MAYPSKGDLKNIPTVEKKVSDLKKKKPDERKTAYDDPTDYLWVLDVEPTVDFYMNALQSDKDDEGNKALNKLKISHKRIEPNKYLFPKMPDIHDVQQAAIGDCWFLAAITSILAVPGGPEYLRSIIDDDGKDWMTVRLYDRALNPLTKTLEFRPRYIRMKRTIVETTSKETIHSRSKDGLWVCALEKAMTAFNHTNLLADDKDPGYYEAFQPHDATYLNLSGGLSHRALELFFGVSFQATDIPKEIEKNYDYYYLFNLLMSPKVPKSGNPQQLIANPPAPTGGIVNRPILNTIEFERFYKETDENSLVLYGDFEDAHTNHYLLKDGKEIEVRGALRQEDFVQFIIYELGIRDIGVKENILKWVSERSIFPGKRGTAKYTAKQIDFFQAVAKQLSESPVCMATQTYIARSSSGKGHSGGEHMSKGLAGGHAYAVMEALIANGEYYLLVANPWGQYGRIYKEILDKDARVKADAAEKEGYFWLDLFDLTKRARNVCYASGTAATEIMNKIKTATKSTQTGIENYPSVEGLPIPDMGNPYAACPEYAYHTGNSYLGAANLIQLKKKLTAIGSTSKMDYISRKYGNNEFDRSIPLKNMKEYMGNVLLFIAEMNKEIHQKRMTTVETNKKDNKKPRNDRNFFLLENVDLRKIQPSRQNVLQLKEWKDASYVSIVASRKRIVPVDKAVEEYIKAREESQKDLKNKYYNLFDTLGALWEQTRHYLNNYPDSDRRLGTGALEYLIILEILRLLELVCLMKMDIPSLSVIQRQGDGIQYLKSIDDKIFERASIPGMISNLYRKKAQLKILK